MLLDVKHFSQNSNSTLLSARPTASLLHDFGDGYEAIAPSREMLPMDPGSERAIVSTPIDSRRKVALQVLRVATRLVAHTNRSTVS